GTDSNCLGLERSGMGARVIDLQCLGATGIATVGVGPRDGELSDGRVWIDGAGELGLGSVRECLRLESGPDPCRHAARGCFDFEPGRATAEDRPDGPQAVARMEGPGPGNGA